MAVVTSNSGRNLRSGFNYVARIYGWTEVSGIVGQWAGGQLLLLLLSDEYCPLSFAHAHLACAAAAADELECSNYHG